MSKIWKRFEEDSYQGKDIVHYGIRIPLSVSIDDVLKKVSHTVRRVIKKNFNLNIKSMEVNDLEVLRNMWFDPNDGTFPKDLNEHVGLTAFDMYGNIVGGILWKKEGNNLFLHQLISNDIGKKEYAPTRLVWESVLRFRKSYFSLDIGVSYNPKRYKFFEHFAVEKYPIILRPPQMTHFIGLSPYRNVEKGEVENTKIDWKSKNATFLPRASYAIYACLKHLGVKEGDEVMIVKTFGSNYISKCVTNMIEKTGATWTLRNFKDAGKIKAVIAIHEFGIPVFQDQDMAILEVARKYKIPIIEDCAWRNSSVWKDSDYYVFSMSKMLNINYGATLYGVHLDDDYLWSIGCFDFVKKNKIQTEAPKSFGELQRVKNWELYHSLVLADGMTPDDCYNYKGAIESGSWVPTVYLQRFESDDIANDIVKRLEDFGIQAGRYWGEPIVFLPVHQSMTEVEVEYMFAVVKGYFNSCHDYVNK